MSFSHVLKTFTCMQVFKTMATVQFESSVHLGYYTTSMGDFNRHFWGLVVPPSRFKCTINPWRWDQHDVQQSQAPLKQCNIPEEQRTSTYIFQQVSLLKSPVCVPYASRYSLLGFHYANNIMQLRSMMLQPQTWKMYELKWLITAFLWSIFHALIKRIQYKYQQMHNSILMFSSRDTL
jgi:hypothetical protein